MNTVKSVIMMRILWAGKDGSKDYFKRKTYNVKFSSIQRKSHSFSRRLAYELYSKTLQKTMNSTTTVSFS